MILNHKDVGGSALPRQPEGISMGVDIWTLDFLLKFKSQPFGRTLTLGRQASAHIEQVADMSRAVMDRLGIFDPLSSIAGYWSDNLLRFLGASSIEVMDVSAYEGATVIQDLNELVPESLHSQFDTIFEGGTLEHIFDFPQAIENIKLMLKPGGLFLSSTVANNYLGHGFYQFSPELMWRVFSANSGFRVERMDLCECEGMPAPFSAHDPATAGERQEIRATRHPTYLFTAARKLGPSVKTKVLQSDYVPHWKAHGDAPID